MAITSFIPEVWAARLGMTLQRSLVIPALVNRYYEGEISKFGDTVHINTLNDITVKTYTPNQEIEDPEQLTGTDSVMTIDHGAYFNFYLDDVDAAQAKADVMEMATKNAAYQLAMDSEDYIVSIIRQEAGIKPMVTMPTEAEGGLYGLLLEIKTALDTNNVPREGRKLVVAPALEAELLKDTDHFIGLGSDASEDRLMNGRIGRLLGMDVHVSNALDSEFAMFHTDAVTFANQITELEAYRAEKRFADGVKGLSLSGAKVVTPKAVCIGTILEE